MVILLSALAVVVAAILLITWVVVQGGFVLIYAAMGFAVLSMLLLWAAKWIGSRPEAVPSAAPAPLPEPAPRPAVATEERSAPVAAPVVHRDDDPSLPVFPIADYDSLWVSQIVPLVAQLDTDELATVEARERGGRHRAAVLDAIASVRTTAAPASASPGDDDLFGVPADAGDHERAEPAGDDFAALWGAPADGDGADGGDGADEGERLAAGGDAAAARPAADDALDGHGGPSGLVGIAADGLAGDRAGSGPAAGEEGAAAGDSDLAADDDDIWVLDDREPFDWTASVPAPDPSAVDQDDEDDDGSGEDGISFGPPPAAPAGTQDVAADGSDDPWDWVPAGAAPPVVHDDLSELFADGGGRTAASAHGSGAAPVPSDDAEAVAAGAPKVRMFLGRRQSSMTVRQR
ncbi:MAG TPA: hypothetical protein VHK88_12090 [Aquihabitans sp.]|nr:hypothetical protein [Aquihabitans sp.]